MWAIKQASQELLPIILHLVNKTISTGQFPSSIKTSKIIPIQKPGKDPMTSEGWRPINIIPAISKIIEKSLLHQLMEHMNRNNLISHVHHGSVKQHSTQTLITEIYDQLVENLQKGQDTALVLLDQSKAYDLINHKILIQKLKALGIKGNSLKLIENFLTDRQQYVHLQGFDSDQLEIGPQSVIQGSTLSCYLYLVYILDIQMVFHSTRHTPEQQRNCTKTNTGNKTFVDDCSLKITPMENQTMNHALLLAIAQAMQQMKTYTMENQLPTG